ncbi:MAG TPA: hypothetical protein VE616_25100 [Candidatus Udaeobacter sp.]|nr:hypothetical protein [Candidatus Udaeobacter sp.]
MRIFFDQMESGLILFYRVFLVIVTIAAVGFAGFLIRYVEDSFSVFYVIVGLLAFFGWVIGQFVSLARRQRLSNFPGVKFTKTQDGPVQTFTFSMGPETTQPGGAAPAPGDSNTVTFSKSFSFGTSSVPKESRPSPTQIEQAERWQREGRDWDSICGWTNPLYAGWEPAEKQVYKALLQALVAAHRVDRAGA